MLIEVINKKTNNKDLNINNIASNIAINSYYCFYLLITVQQLRFALKCSCSCCASKAEEAAVADSGS